MKLELSYETGGQPILYGQPVPRWYLREEFPDPGHVVARILLGHNAALQQVLPESAKFQLALSVWVAYTGLVLHLSSIMPLK